MTQAQNPPPLLCKRPELAGIPAPSRVGVTAARPTDRLLRSRAEVPLLLGAWPPLPSLPAAPRPEGPVLSPPLPPRQRKEGREQRRLRRTLGRPRPSGAELSPGFGLSLSAPGGREPALARREGGFPPSQPLIRAARRLSASRFVRRAARLRAGAQEQR